MSCEKLKTMQSELKELINNNNTTNQQYENFYEKYNIPYKNKVESEIRDNCGKISAQSGVNIIKIDPKCIKNAEELCMKIHNVSRERVDGDPNLLPWRYRDCYDKYGPQIIGVTQTNFSDIKSACTVNTVLNDPELINNKEMAIVVAMILADQEIKCKSTENNDYFYNFGTTQNILSINRCLNMALSNQKNYMSGCRFSNKRQENISDLVNNCIIKTTIGNPTDETNEENTYSPDFLQSDIPSFYSNQPPAKNTPSTKTNSPSVSNSFQTNTPFNTTTPTPSNETLNIIIVIVIILAAIFVGYKFF